MSFVFVAAVIASLFYSLPSFAFLDFLGEQAKRAAETAAYADAVGELANEISPDSSVKEAADNLYRRSEKLRSEASELQYLSRSTKQVLEGPDWTSKRLETNIRSTTDFIRKVKRLIARIAALGTAGATALNTTETNLALNEMQRNQQALLIQNEEAKIHAIEKEREERKEWSEFSKRQRSLRQKGAKNGKS